MSSKWADMARLVRRTGFGATGDAVDAALALGAPAYVEALLSADPSRDAGAVATPAPTFPPVAPIGKNATKDQRSAHNKALGAQLTSLTSWWLQRMAAVELPFVEKLTFAWHNHFATAATKVRSAPEMMAQNATLRAGGRGDFRSLALAMLTDAAMLRWLDGEQNTAGAANENLAREFMELFALGHGNGYTEDDVREGARALTGWRIRSDGTTYLDQKKHDQGAKTMLGVTGKLDQVGYCDAVLAAVGSPRYLAARWWGQLVSDQAPPSDVLDRLVAAYGPSRSMTGLLRAMLTAPEFAAAQGTSVLSPVEWSIGAVRALRYPLSTEAAGTKLAVVLRGLGQLPFYPPSVGGWPAGQAWLSTAAADLRMQTAVALATGGDISVVSSAAPADRLATVAHLLAVESWSDRSAAALRAMAGDPVQLVAVALNTPEYLTN